MGLGIQKRITMKKDNDVLLKLEDVPLCICGCGKHVKWNKKKKQWNMYINGHGIKRYKTNIPKKYKTHKEILELKASEPPLCACGCGDPVTWNIQGNHWNTFIFCHYRKLQIGEKHPKYTNGHRKKLNDWRIAVKERDNYTCQHCFGKSGCKSIVAHHKKSRKEYPKLMYILKNGQTLCRRCHRLVHMLVKRNVKIKSKKVSF